MSKKKLTVTLIVIVFAGITSFFSIRFTNDHLECDDVVSKTKYKDGNTIITTKHICR